jgi:predicted P-loop ATPase
MTPQELLLANSITTLRSYAPGNYSTTCPQCSNARKRDHQKLKCLSIKIDGDGACWCCHHCGWDGPEKSSGGNGAAPPLKCYAYGESLRKVRNAPGRKPKCFWQHLNGSGEWESGAGGIKTATMLYRFAEVHEAIADGETIAVVEGEKDADSLWRIGVPATCNAHGASEPGKAAKWTSAHSRQLSGANLVVFNDNDVAGYAHARAVVACSISFARQVRRLDLKEEWPGITDGGDVSDWLNGGGGTPERLLELIETAPVIAAEARDGEAAPGLMQQKKGGLYSNIGNALVFLESEPVLKDMLVFDEMRGMPMLQHPVPRPGATRVDAGFEPRPVRDEDATTLACWLQWNGLRTISKTTVWDAILKCAHDRAVHPVRDSLDGLQWDKTERVERLLPAYFGADDTEYTREVGLRFLLSIVARVYRPGCKADCCLVLEGEEGILKSQACEILAGKEWFSDTMPDITHGKDAMEHLRGVWLIEIGELHPIKKAEVTQLKNFLSTTVDRFRPRYGRATILQPRQCVFVCTTNEQQYLQSTTGNRRFWPVLCGMIDIQALIRDRDQLFAEAVHRYHNSEQWWPSNQFQKDVMAPEQEARREPDPWESVIDEWLGKRLKQKNRSKFTVADVAEEALELEKGRLGRRESNRIVACLTRAGCERGARTGTARWWYPPGSLKL